MKPEEIMDCVVFERGRGVFNKNVQLLFSAIKETVLVSGSKTINRIYFEKHIPRFKKYLEELKTRGEIEIYYSTVLGSPLKEIKILKESSKGDVMNTKENQNKIVEIKNFKKNFEKSSGGILFEGYSFIDVPNLTGPGYVDVYRMNWLALLGIILKPSEGRVVQTKPRAYSFLPTKHNKKEEWVVHNTLIEAGYESSCNERKTDIDSWLVSGFNSIDIKPNTNYYITLVSGDVDYLHPLKEFIERVKKSNSLIRLRVVIWSDCLSGDLREFADEVFILDNFHKQLDFKGWVGKNYDRSF